MTTEDSSAISSASSESCSEKIEAMKTASDLLAQGKRNMVCGEVPKAVGLYEEAVQLLVKTCGEMSRDCADAYFCCGSALLELGRMETNVLGVALEGVEVEEEKEEETSEQFEKPPADEGEERQKLRVEVYEAMAEGEREEQFQKVLLEKSKVTSTDEIGGLCDNTAAPDNMETDILADKREDTEVSKAGVINEQSSNNAEGKEEENVIASASDECKPEEKKDDSVTMDTNVTKNLDSCAGDKNCEDDRTSASDECKPEEKKDDSVTKNLDSCTGDKNCEDDRTSASDECKPEEKKDDSVAKDTNVTKNLDSCAGDKNCEDDRTSASDECKPEEKKDDSVTKNLDSCTEGDKNCEDDRTSASDECKPEEKKDDSVTKNLDSCTEGDKNCEDDRTSASDECKPEEKKDDSVTKDTNVTKNLDSCAGGDKNCEDDRTSASDECKPEEKKDDSVAEVSEKCNSNGEEKKSVSPLASTQEKVDGQVDNEKVTELGGSNPAIDTHEKVVDGQVDNEKVTEEIMDASENALVTEKPESTTEDGKEMDSVSISAESKRDEEINKCAVERETVTEKCGSGTESSNQEGPVSTSGCQEETRCSEKAENQIEDKSDNANKLSDAEKIESEAMVVDDQEIENQTLNSSNVGCGIQSSLVLAESNDKVLADDPTVPSEAEENADVEMADNDGMDVEDEEDDDDDKANTDDIQESEANEDEKEEVPNFQLAWEYLDLAKVLYLKSDTADDQLKAAQCYMKLGELSMETGQHAIAAEDLGSALKIQQKYLPANDRLIAETLYQLGLAYGLSGEYEQSIQRYTQAIGVIESKIESLNKLVQEKEVNGENKENAELGECARYLDEIKELQELIPEIKNKIEDTNQEAKDIEQMKHVTKEALGLSHIAKATASVTNQEAAIADKSGALNDNVEQSTKVSDIGHLVRKKRKPEVDVSDADLLEMKKLRPDGDCSNNTVLNNGTPQLETNIIVEGCSPKQIEDNSDVSVEPVAS